MADITQILSKIEEGDPNAADQLLPIVYDELRKLAAAKMNSENPGNTLQATALVHEAFIRLTAGDGETAWDGRGHFFAAAAEAMRRILINRARNRKRLKRGGNRKRVDFENIQVALDTPDEDLLALNEAIDVLEKDDSTAAELVKLRFFSGLSHGEAARTLSIPRRSADRLWAYARAFLIRCLESNSDSS
jgi:RNA polymerase sigma factor (TIGR02999 family)